MPRKEEYAAPVTIEAVVQADIGGMTIAFTSIVTAEEMDDRLDACRKAINRQRAQQELVEALVDIQARRDALATSPTREREMLKQRADERVRLAASFEAAHNASGARSEFKLSATQRSGLAQFDADTEKNRAEFATDRAKVGADLPVYEARAARARAIIAGAERSQVIERGMVSLAQAAE